MIFHNNLCLKKLSEESTMQITINVPDNLPSSIVQQYINTIKTQMCLISELMLTKISHEPKKTLTTDVVTLIRTHKLQYL